MSKKPVIALVFHNSNIQSGATRSFMDIISNLNKMNKYDFVGIFPYKDGSAIDYFKKEISENVFKYHYGGLIQDLTKSKTELILQKPIIFLKHIRSYLQAVTAKHDLKDINVSMVYTNTSGIIFGGILAKVLKCKNIWNIREFRVKDHKITFYLGEKSLKRFINKNSEKVLYVSKSVMDYNSDIIDPSKSAVIYNSYDDSFIMPKEKFNYTDTLNIMLAGEIKEGKGQLVAVQALNKVVTENPSYKIKMFIAGKYTNKEYYDKLVDYINSHKLNQYVELLGHVSDMQKLKKDMDISIVPSKNEAFGRVTVESRLSMLAVIGNNSAGTAEQISHGQNGLLYNDDPNELAQCIKMLYNDRCFMEKLAKAGFYEAKDLYASGKIYKTVEQAIDEVLAV